MYDLLKTRRSIRKYQDRAIEKEKIDIILRSALLSPSSRARRPWEFVAVTDKEVLNKLSRCREHGADFIKNAPLAVVVIADPKKCDVWIEDTSITSTVIQLSAQSLGLGSCWIQVRDRYYDDETTSEDYIKAILEIPSEYRVENMVAIGYSAEEKIPINEDDFLNKIHYGKYIG